MNKNIIFSTSLLFLLILTQISCSNKSDKSDKSKTESQDLPAPTTNDPSGQMQSGENYSDSIVHAMVKETIDERKPAPIDSLRDLHNFDYKNMIDRNTSEFNLDSISSFLKLNNPVSKQQTQLLQVTDFLADISFSDKYNTYIFLDKNTESHYGPSIKLINILKNQTGFSPLILAQQYLSEGYDYKITSKIQGAGKIRVSKTENFKRRENNKSTKTRIFDYEFDQDGNTINL